jgi:hypothetical protein
VRSKLVVPPLTNGPTGISSFNVLHVESPILDGAEYADAGIRKVSPNARIEAEMGAKPARVLLASGRKIIGFAGLLVVVDTDPDAGVGAGVLRVLLTGCTLLVKFLCVCLCWAAVIDRVDDDALFSGEEMMIDGADDCRR